MDEENPHKWVLLAEDDKLFAMLFQKFWKERFPAVELRLVESIVDGKELLSQCRSAPEYAVLDLNLRDGSSRALEEQLSCPYLIWSASAQGRETAKPAGRTELNQAIAEIGEKGGLISPCNRGHTQEGRE